jgi:hypothetical protein
MPVGNYRWMDEEEWIARDWTQFDEASGEGYILEVDLIYPKELHLLHSSLPLAPHRMKIDETILSSYSRQCLLEVNGKVQHQSEKLVSTFLPRNNYVLHSANLALYLNLGMKLTKIHRILSFTQSTFLRTYIQFCTAKRTASKSEFRKRLFKSFSNSNFGKFIEQTRSHLDCHIVTDKAKFEKWAACPRYSSFKILAGDIVAVFLKRPNVRMKQAWGIGFSILERSKWLVYHHYYNIIKPALDNRCSVIFTDTDSLALRIATNLDMNGILDRLSSIMDYSNYPPTHPRFNLDRKNKLFFWKDECLGQTMLEFVGLSSKTYSIRMSSEEGAIVTSSKCKGVAKGFRKKIPFEDYKKCITGINSHSVMQHTIQSYSHQIRTVKMTRRCFSSFDDKRFVCPCGIHTIPYGSRYIAVVEKMKRCIFC